MSCVTSLSPSSESESAWWMDRCSIHRMAISQISHTAAQCVVLVPGQSARPAFLTPTTPMSLFPFPKILSHQEGQEKSKKKKVLCRIVTQEESECAHPLFLYWASLFSGLIPATHPPLCIWDSPMTQGRSNEMTHPSREETCARCFTNQKITQAVQSRQWQSCWDQPWEVSPN